MPSDFLEKTLEDIIFENRSVINQYGLSPFRRTAFRQVILPSGKKIDILGFDINDGHINFDIYELKRDFINTDAVCQAYNYLEEIRWLIMGHFKSWDATIIMVGKRYEPISILDGMKIPIEVYTYEYKLNGIRFTQMRHDNSYHNPSEDFSLGVWAWGLDMLTFTDGHPLTMNFHTSILRHLDGGNFETKLREAKKNYNKPIPLLEEPVIIKEPKVITEVFPLQPSWSVEFAKEIPPCESILEEFELEEEDYADFEPEELELDNCDYEAEPDLEEDYYNIFVEPVNWYDYTLSPLVLPTNYYISNQSPSLK